MAIDGHASGADGMRSGNSGRARGARKTLPTRGGLRQGRSTSGARAIVAAPSEALAIAPPVTCVDEQAVDAPDDGVESAHEGEIVVLRRDPPAAPRVDAPTSRPAAPTLHVGEFLRAAREAKGMQLCDISSRTRIPEHQFVRLEAGDLDALPAEVFVRGFIRNYARAVGADGDEAMRRYQRMLDTRSGTVRRPVEVLNENGEPTTESATHANRRRIGVALAVLLLLLIATLTVSLLLRHPAPPTVGGIS